MTQVNSNELIDMISRIDLIVKKLETRTNNIDAILTQRDNEAFRNAKLHMQALEKIQKNTDQVMSQSKAIILKETKDAVNTAMNDVLTDIEKRLKNSSGDLSHNVARLQMQVMQVVKQSKALMWKSLAVFGLGAISIIAMFTWYGTEKGNALIKLRQEHTVAIQSAAYIDNVKNIKIQSCDKKPCIKIDLNAKKYGENADFLVISNEAD